MSPPNPISMVTDQLRSVLGVAEQAEHEVTTRNPIGQMHDLEGKIDEAIAAFHRSCEATEKHVETLATLSETVPALSDAVTKLTLELNGLLAVVAPLVAAEREVSRVEHFFTRGRHRDAPPGS